LTPRQKYCRSFESNDDIYIKKILVNVLDIGEQMLIGFVGKNKNFNITKNLEKKS